MKLALACGQKEPMLRGIQNHLVYIDETGFSLWTKRAFGRGRVGDTVNRQVGGHRVRNVTVIAAISDIGGKFSHLINLSSVSKIFPSFVASVDAILGGDRPTVILDNAPIHNGIMEVLDNAPIHNGIMEVLDNAPIHNGIIIFIIIIIIIIINWSLL